MGNPALRLVELVKTRIKLIVVGAIAGAFAGAFIGLMSPVLFRSAAIIKINMKSQPMISTGQPVYDSILSGTTPGEQAVKDALNYIYAPIIMEKVSAEVMKLKLDPDLAFPNRVRTVDLPARFRLMARRINNRFDLGMDTGIEKPIDERDDPNIVATLIQNQMEVIPNAGDLSIAINIESSDAWISKTIADQISKEFVEYSNLKDQEKLKKQEEYLVKTLEFQESQIDEIEDTLRTMRTKTPDLQITASGGSPTSGSAFKFSEQKGALESLEVELRTNVRLYKQYKAALKEADLMYNVKNEGLRKKLETELGQLEYKRLEYTVIQGYSEKHPQLLQLDNKITKIKGLLQNLDRDSKVGNKKSKSNEDALTQLSPLELRTRINKVKATIEVLKVKKELAESQLSSKQVELQTSLEAEQRASTLLRDLETHLVIVNELRQRLEEIRIQMVGTEETASILIPASLPLIPVTLSVYRRVFFGFFIGAAIIITLIFLLDMINPKLLLLEDLTQSKIAHFGKFKFNQDSMIDFTSCLLTLKDKEIAADNRDPTVILFTMISISVNLESWVSEIAILLKNSGFNCGVAIVDKKSPQIRRESMLIEGIETNFIHADEISFMYDRILNSMKEKYEFILVLSTSLAHGPATVFMTRSAEHVFYISKMAQSELMEIERVRQASVAEDASEFALILET